VRSDHTDRGVRAATCRVIRGNIPAVECMWRT
jgi:hypothetical protein